jgi:hypothetical protein
MTRDELSIITKAMRVQPFACLGCSHYHGKIEFGIPLVCGYQPNGPERDNCPYKEARE